MADAAPVRWNTCLVILMLLAGGTGLSGARVSVRALDQLTGVPIVDTSLILAGVGRGESSDASGWVVMEDLEIGIYEGILSSDGYASRRIRIELNAGDPVHRMEVLLTPQIHDLEAFEVSATLSDADQDALRKRNAAAPVEQISGQELMDVTDENIGDSLSRIAGINVDEEDGNVTGVNIRGAGPKQTRITLDGQSMAGGGGRGTTRGAGSMSQIPREFLNRVEIMKAPTPDKDADAIGGTIDLQTSRIASSKVSRTTISARSGYDEAGDTFNHRASIAYAHPMAIGDSGKRFGVLVALNTQESDGLSDEIRILNYWPLRKSPDTGERIPVLGRLRASLRDTYSTGYGLVINTDLFLNNNNSFQLKGMWNTRDYNMLSEYHTLDFLRGKIESLTPMRGEFSRMSLEKQFYDSMSKSSTGNLVLAADHRIGDWRLDESIGYSLAESRSDNTQSLIFRTGKTFDGTYDMSDSLALPRVELSSNGTILTPEDLMDPEPFRINRYELLDDSAEDKELAFRVNLTKRWNDDQNKWIFKSGIKARLRDAFRDLDRFKHSVKPAFYLDEIHAEAKESTVFRGHYPIGPSWSAGAMRSYYSDNRDDFSLDPLDVMLDAYASDYSVSESIYATYGMFQRESDKWILIGGMRIERTDSETQGYQTISQEIDGERVVEVNPVSISDSYDMLFPGLHFLYRPVPKLAIRGSLTRTLQRPDFRDLSPSTRVDLDTRRIRAGNPDLQPFDAKAVDLGTDFVINQYASASLGFFYKRIDDFIVDVQEETEYLGEPNFILSHPVNGSPADLLGVESYLSTQLPFLPGPFDDTSLSINYTLTDSTAAYPGYPGEVIMLPDQVKQNLSVSLRWRLGNMSMSWRTHYKGLKLDDLRVPGQDEFDAGYWSHSVSVSYKVNDVFSLSIGAANLNVPDRLSYQGVPQQPTMNREGSRSYSIGLNIRFSGTPDTGKPSRGQSPDSSSQDEDDNSS